MTSTLNAFLKIHACELILFHCICFASMCILLAGPLSSSAAATDTHAGGVRALRASWGTTGRLSSEVIGLDRLRRSRKTSLPNGTDGWREDKWWRRYLHSCVSAKNQTEPFNDPQWESRWLEYKVKINKDRKKKNLIIASCLQPTSCRHVPNVTER